LEKRVAPRCTIADELFIVNVRRGKIAATEKLKWMGRTGRNNENPDSIQH
jgi:hypothetical protein